MQMQRCKQISHFLSGKMKIIEKSKVKNIN